MGIEAKSKKMFIKTVPSNIFKLKSSYLDNLYNSRLLKLHLYSIFISFFLLVNTFVLTGCTLFKTKNASNNDALNNSNLNQNSSSPFEIKISKEKFDGTKLIVDAELSSNYDWEAHKAVAILRSLEDGEVLHENQTRISDAPKVVKKGETFPVNLEVSAKGMTDYQLELAWGLNDAKLANSDFAKSNLAKSNLAKSLENNIKKIENNTLVNDDTKASLNAKVNGIFDPQVKDPAKDQVIVETKSIETNIESIGKPKGEIGNMKSSPNSDSVKVTADLYNAGTGQLKKATVEIKYIKANSETVNKRVEINNLTLQPGDSKKLSLTIKTDSSIDLSTLKLQVIESF